MLHDKQVIGSGLKHRIQKARIKTMETIGNKRGKATKVSSEYNLPGNQLVGEEELVAHINSTSYPRRSEALEETPDAAITTTTKDPP